MHQMSKFQTTRMHNVNIVMYIIHRENYALFSRKQTLTFCCNISVNIKLTKILPYRHLSLNSHVIFKIKCIFQTQNASFRQVFIHFLWLQCKISKMNKKIWFNYGFFLQSLCQKMMLIKLLLDLAVFSVF